METRNQKKKPNKSPSQGIMDMLQQDSIFAVITRPLSTHYVAIIDDTFNDTQQFEDVVDVLNMATENDVVTIELTTDGGSLQSVIPLINAMKNSQAFVHVQCISDVASAGTFLMMMADTCYVNEYATIMLHNVQFGAIGSGSSVGSVVKHTLASSEALIRDMYSDWLTEEEIAELLIGKDFYFTPEECHTRFKIREQVRSVVSQEEE